MRGRSGRTRSGGVERAQVYLLTLHLAFLVFFAEIAPRRGPVVSLRARAPVTRRLYAKQKHNLAP